MAASTVNILLVDDKPENLFALEELLRQPDRQLFTALSGNDALRLLLKHEFALVLLDVDMPEMDGYETAQLMRSAERTRLVPIIFVTAGDRSEERTFRGYEAGAVDFLYKPINSHTLKSKVNVFIELHRKTRELERTAQALRDKIADLENVNQTLSHDLRAPLRSIRAFSRVLAESGSTLDAEGADALDRISKAANRMTSMVEDLYNLLRLSADDATVDNVDLGNVLRDVCENLRSDLDAVKGTVTHDKLPIVRTNRRLIVQLLQNLLANALKFHGEAPPTVHVSATQKGDRWQISVKDNGVGIPPDARERVFGLFSRLDSTRSGTGVGLALCKRAIQKLGGTIWIGAEPGPGTTFYFTIPVRPDLLPAE
jgi:signal transduction histidine kinase